MTDRGSISVTSFLLQSTREKVIKALVVLGGDLSAKNKSGQTVYSIAKETGSRSTMALLSRVGADDEKFLNCKAYPPISDTGRCLTK